MDGKSKAKDEPADLLADFESAAYRGERIRALELLGQILVSANEHGRFSWSDTGRSDDALIHRDCTRFAAAATALLADPRTPVTRDYLRYLAPHQPQFVALFHLSGFGGTRPLVDAIRTALEPVFSAAVPASYDAALGRLLFGASLYEPSPYAWPELMEKKTELALPFYLAALSERIVVTEGAEMRRRALYESAEAIDRITTPQPIGPRLTTSWMYCSYAATMKRHPFKRHLNGYIRGLLAASGHLGREIGSPPRRDKPVIAVLLEVFPSRHAMYRCYAPFLRQLRRRFHVVAFCMANLIDDMAKETFDEVVLLDPKQSALDELLDRIAELRPDMVYYPSVGMIEWCVFACNLRLAPIQVLGLGHPATTNSPEMDYVVMGADHFTDPGLFSEKAVVLRSDGNLLEMRWDAQAIEPEIRADPRPLRVAVVGKTMKITAPLIALCRRVEELASRPLEFHYFPSEVGLDHAYCRARIQAAHPGAVVHPRAEYNAYLRLLRACDVRFSTFPFGGSNTNVDGFLLGLPVVVYSGNEPHSRTDRRFLRMFGLPDWLIAESADDYLAAALRLIVNDGERVAIAEAILAARPDQVMFERQHALYPDDFVETFWWIYRHHAELAASDKRFWTAADRDSADATPVPAAGAQ